MLIMKSIYHGMARYQALLGGGGCLGVSDAMRFDATSLERRRATHPASNLALCPCHAAGMLSGVSFSKDTQTRMRMSALVVIKNIVFRGQAKGLCEARRPAKSNLIGPSLKSRCAGLYSLRIKK